ncbi:MAG: GNAT family N-acetyltransferase [Pseudomonadota bacterium]
MLRQALGGRGRFFCCAFGGFWQNRSPYRVGESVASCACRANVGYVTQRVRSISQRLEHKLLQRIDQVPPAEWNALAGTHPFVRHEFLDALEDGGAVSDYSGWTPRHLWVTDADAVVAALPLYEKTHSYGEFVFDWAWAEAAERAGISYYPKWLVASPLTPVTGPRLLGPDREALPGLLTDLSRAQGISSVHVNFVTDADARLLRHAGWLERSDWQYHWYNRDYETFDDFLAQLSHKKRKNIRQERRRLGEAGWTFERIAGAEATEWHWLFMHGLYRSTFERKGNWPLLTQGIFRRLGQQLASQVLLVLAKKDDHYRAGAYLMHDGHTLYGRYWGAMEAAPGLHFETCYYQGIEHCIEQRLKVFNPGAQGTHKIARGFEPQETRSFHLIHHSGLREAVARSLKVERHAQEQRGEALRDHSPFRKEQQ